MVTFHLKCRYFTGHSNNPDGTTAFVAGTTGAKQGFMGAISIFTIAVCKPNQVFLLNYYDDEEHQFFPSELILQHLSL